MPEQKITLSQQLNRVEIAGELLEKAPMHKTKKAAMSLGNETKALLAMLVGVVEQHSLELKQID